MSRTRARRDFPALEFVVSILGHLFIGVGLVVADSLAAETDEYESDDPPRVVQITQVSILRQADGQPDRATRRPTPSSDTTPTTETTAEPSPRPSTQPSPQPNPEPRESRQEPSEDDIISALPNLEAPEGTEDREATSTEGSERPILGTSDVGQNSDLGRWMISCGETIRSSGVIPHHFTSELEPGAYVTFLVSIGDTGRVTNPSREPVAPSPLPEEYDQFKDAVYGLLTGDPRCERPPPEFDDYSGRVRIRVPAHAGIR